MKDVSLNLHPDARPVEGPRPTLAGLRAASRKRKALQVGMVAGTLALLFLGLRQNPVPELPASEVMAVMDEINSDPSAETPPGTEILSIFDPPSDDPDDWSL